MHSLCDEPPDYGTQQSTPAAGGRAGTMGSAVDPDSARLLVEHEHSLYALCRGMLSHADDADDAVQETLLRALRALPSFRRDASLRTWLSRIAVNVCLEWRRTRQRRDLIANEVRVQGAREASVEATAVQRLLVLEALRGLRPHRRAVLLLKELEGWSVAEIAAAFSWNSKRVENELYHARRALTEWRQRQNPEE